MSGSLVKGCNKIVKQHSGTEKALILGMFSIHFFKKLWVLPILILAAGAWLLSSASTQTKGDFSPEKINLALRRTADRLLRQSGDTKSLIPSIKQAAAGVWQVHLEQPFQYDQLPALLQSSLDLYGIRQPYDVAVRQCSTAIIDLGYHQRDFQNDSVPCVGREMAAGCHFIEITFLENTEKKPFGTAISGVLLLILGGLGGFLFFQQQKQPLSPTPATPEDGNGLVFGNFRLNVADQVLLCGGIRQTLTFRETKLLCLFASSPNQLLERDFILQQVWADEGVLVGRSVDMFVSRLRKKLALDPSVGIVAVHGVGYRLETGKLGA